MNNVTISGRDIVIPAAPLTVPPVINQPNPRVLDDENFATFIAELQEMLDACGPQANKNDRLETIIVACISECVDTQDQIYRVAKYLRFEQGHIFATLGDHRSKRPNSRWRCSFEGRYSLVD